MIFEEWTNTPTLDLLLDKWSIYRDKTLSMLNIKDNISILLLNVSSLNRHMVEIFKLIDTTSPSIITLNGTHHDERSTKQFTKHFFNYNVFSINGTNAFGGVLVAIHKSIRTQRMVEFENIPNLIALEIGEEQNKFQLVTCYSPPHEQIPFEIFDRILQKNENTIFTGDLNAKHNSWSRSVENPKGKTLFNWLSSSPTHATMEIINKFIPTSTRSKATIDLIIAPSHMASDTFSVLPSIGSDHHPVIWRSTIKISTAHQKYPIKRTHWKLFEVFLTFTGSYWNKLAEDMAHSTTFFTLYERFLSLSISRFTNVTFRKSFKPTLPQNIILLINKKHMYLKLFRRTYHPYYAIMLRDISKLVQKTLFQYKRKLWLDYCGSFNDCDTKSFWQKAKRHFRSKSTPVEGFVINNNTITSPDEMCAVAKNYYEEQFTDHQDTKTDIDIEARINKVVNVLKRTSHILYAEQAHQVEPAYANSILITMHYNLARVCEASFEFNKTETLYKENLREHSKYVDCVIHLGSMVHDRASRKELLTFLFTDFLLFSNVKTLLKNWQSKLLQPKSHLQLKLFRLPLLLADTFVPNKISNTL
ncbi:unnamed protein product [Rotaria sp. Silwood1]|nr:unnamed protein product [Rotaria sp. Silwood1]